MSKRIFSLILAAVMVFSLLPVFASAEGADFRTVAAAKTTPMTSGEMTTDSMVTNKWLTENGNAYDLTMSAYATGGTMTQELESDVPLDIVLVLDQSGSMLATDMASAGGYVSAGNKAWTVSQAVGYYVKDGDNYYELKAERGNIYTGKVHPYLTDDLLGTTYGEDWHTGWESRETGYYVVDENNGSPRLTKLYSASIGYVGGYDCVFYYYDAQGNTHYIPFNSANGSTTASYSRSGWSLGTGSMNSNSNRLWTTAYWLSSAESYNQLYYTKDGTDVLFGPEVTYDNQTVYTGDLYYYSEANQTRLEALRAAAKQFVATVAERSAATGADHRIAVAGFAGNRQNSISGNLNHIVENNGVDTNQFNYVNTGLFVDGTFKNFGTLLPTDDLPLATNGYLTNNGTYMLEFMGAYTYRNYRYTETTNNSGYTKGQAVPAWQDGNSLSYTVHLNKDGTFDEYKAYLTYDSNSNVFYYTYGNVRYVFYGSYTINNREYNNRLLEAEFTQLSSSDYVNALEHVNVNLKPAGDSSTDTNGNGVNDYIDQALDKVDAYGATYVTYGISMANQVFENNAAATPDGTERKRVIVVFTDGSPGPGTQANPFDQNVANEALQEAARSKSMYDATVYTIGLYPNNSLENRTETFLTNLSSSSYVSSTKVYNTDLQRGKTYYYFDPTEKKTFAVTTPDTGYYFYYTDNGVSHAKAVSSFNGRIYKAGTNVEVSKNNLELGEQYDVYGTRLYDNGPEGWITVNYGYRWYDTDGILVTPNMNSSDTSHYQFFTSSDPVPDQSGTYAFTVSDAAGLNAAFKTISESVQTPYTTVQLDSSNSSLRDYISPAFNVSMPEGVNPSNVSFSLEYCNGNDLSNFTVPTNTTEAQTILSGLKAEWKTSTETVGGQTVTHKYLDVTGFDYSRWYVAQGHPGYKLVVKISGLTTTELGKLYSNESSSGVYKDDSMVAPLPMPYITKEAEGSETYVMDFGAKMNIAESGKFQVAVSSIDGKNGTFFNSDTNGASGTISYQLKAGEALSDGADLTMSGADTAIIYGRFYDTSRTEGTKTAADSAAWKNVTVVPASSVYFDDSFNTAQNSTTLTVGDGSGYNSGVAAKTTAPDFAATVDFTFTGTGIDVYCTTDKAGQYVRAVVMKNGEVFENNGERQDVQMKNYSETTRYNVPTVSFRDLPSDTYTLKLIAPASTHYKLDGIRVYNPVADSNYTGTAASEAQATFWNLRDALVNSEGTEALQFKDDKSEVYGVLFLDDASRLDPDNLITSYENNSPKNEIYLDCSHAATNDQPEKAAQSISFTLDPEAAAAAEAGHLWIGLSAPDDSTATNANTGVVTLKKAAGENPAKTISVTSAVDMYYPITSDMIGDGNVVTITNSGTTMISVTNLKVTGVEFPEEVVGQAKVFGAYTMKSLRIAANNGVDPDAVATPEPTPDPTPTPTQQPDFLSLIRQVISDFVSSLFGSIARLFGH